MTKPTGIIIRQSPFTVKQTIDRLMAALEAKGATIYARIDQQQELKKVNQTIRPVEFLLFGNPKVGGPAMTENIMVALDLPLKAVAWEDENKDVQIAYNTAAYIKSRYSLSAAIAAPLDLEPLITEILSWTL